MLYVFGVGEIPISISGSPLHPERLVHTTRAVGTVTNAMRDTEARRRGRCARTIWHALARRRRRSGSDVVIVAGGIGLAPLRPVLYHVLAHREHYGKVVLLYGTRSPDDILFRERTGKAWRARFDLEVHVTVDYADAHGTATSVSSPS